MLRGSRPENLGVSNGKLAKPSETPNCVASQASLDDAEHYIAPILIAEVEGLKNPVEKLKSIVMEMKGSHLIVESADYLYFEFSSGLLGFVDDVELYAVASEGVVHVRSASRLGQKDFGVNRKRIEHIRDIYENPDRLADDHNGVGCAKTHILRFQQTKMML